MAFTGNIEKHLDCSRALCALKLDIDSLLEMVPPATDTRPRFPSTAQHCGASLIGSLGQPRLEHSPIGNALCFSARKISGKTTGLLAQAHQGVAGCRRAVPWHSCHPLSRLHHSHACCSNRCVEVKNRGSVQNCRTRAQEKQITCCQIPHRPPLNCKAVKSLKCQNPNSYHAFHEPKRGSPSARPNELAQLYWTTRMGSPSVP